MTGPFPRPVCSLISNDYSNVAGTRRVAMEICQQFISKKVVIYPHKYLTHFDSLFLPLTFTMAHFMANILYIICQQEMN